MARTINIEIETALGKINVELYPDAAPITVANFLYYVESGAYDGGLFHRSVRMDNQPDNDVKIEVIQGGINPNAEADEPIPLERTSSTGLSHSDGALSMGRLEPDSARSE